MGDAALRTVGSVYAADMALPTVSVVISTQTRERLLREIIGLLLDDPATTEIVVALDGGSDAIWGRLQQLSATESRVRCVRTAFGRQLETLQAGVEAARGEVILMLDDDVVPAPGLVAGHARWHAGRDNLLVLGYMPVDRSPTSRVAAMTRQLYGSAYDMAVSRYEREPDAVLRQLWSGNVSMPRDTILEVGLPGTIQGYSADQELGLRLGAAGVTGVFDRSLRAEHRYERSLTRMREDQAAAGYNQMLIHRAWPQQVSASQLIGSVARRDKLLLAMARRDRPRAALAGVLMGAGRVAIELSRDGLATRLLLSASALERRRGMAAAVRASREQEPEGRAGAADG